MNTQATAKTNSPLFPHMLTSGRCTVCPDTRLNWVFADPKTKTKHCMDCLVASVLDPAAAPLLVQLGTEILTTRLAEGLPLDDLPLDDLPLDIIAQAQEAEPVDIAAGRRCSDCGKHGATWQVMDSCEQFCLACTKRFIECLEAEVRQGYVALARLEDLPEA